MAEPNTGAAPPPSGTPAPGRQTLTDPDTGETIKSLGRVEPALDFVDPAHARAEQTYRYLMKAPGADPEAVLAAAREQHPDFKPDVRSLEQKQVDKEYGVNPAVDPARYFFGAPSTVTDTAAKISATQDIGSVAANMGLNPNQGNAFCAAIAAEITAGDQAAAGKFPDETAHILSERSAANEARIRSLFPDDAKHAAAVKSVNGLLDDLKSKVRNAKLIDGLRPGSVLCSAPIFFNLYSQAQHLGAWKNARGMKP